MCLCAAHSRNSPGALHSAFRYFLFLSQLHGRVIHRAQVTTQSAPCGGFRRLQIVQPPLLSNPRTPSSLQRAPPPLPVTPQFCPKPFLKPLTTSCLWTRLFWTFPISGITHCVACVAGFSHEHRVFRVHPRCGECQRLPPFHGRVTPSVRTGHTACVHLAADGHLRCSHLWPL